MSNFTHILILFLALLFLHQGIAQESDTLGMDSSYVSDEIKTSKKLKLLGEYPNPKAALGLSLVLPGAGQAYNKKYWKIPIIYGVFGYLAYKIDDNKKNYEDYKKAYELRVDGDEDTVDKYAGVYNDATLKRLRNLRKKGLESNWIFVVVTYLLNGVDAYVDAHLLEFDISEDLSINLNPSVQPNDQFSNPTPGMGLRIALSF